MLDSAETKQQIIQPRVQPDIYYTIYYNGIPLIGSKQLQTEYYINIWNSSYINSENTMNTKLLIPNVHYKLSLFLWPNNIITQFLIKHCSFHSYQYKMRKIILQTLIMLKCLHRWPESDDRMLLVLQNKTRSIKSLPLPLISKFYVNTVSVTDFFHSFSTQFNNNLIKSVKL